MARGKPRISDASQASGRNSSRSSSLAPADRPSSVPPFFNTTFSTHRVSPLFIGPERLTTTRLETLARRLRDTLVGDVVRGIQIGLEATDTPTGQVGALRTVKIRWFRPDAVLGERDDDEAQTNEQRAEQGLWIDIRHENAAYVALLLPGTKAEANKSKTKPSWAMQPLQATDNQAPNRQHFVSLPLLLLRMPLALKTVIGDWLSSTFDCRVSRLSLGTMTLVNMWEGWLAGVGVSSNGPDFTITLGFNAPLHAPKERESRISEDEEEPSDHEQAPAGLRTLDITIAAQDIQHFVSAGEEITPAKDGEDSWKKDPREYRRLVGDNADDGWAWRTESNVDIPFTKALATYLDRHMALDLFHPSVRVTQISCGGFVLGQNRLKILQTDILTEELSRGAWLFVTLLGERIQGKPTAQVFSAS